MALSSAELNFVRNAQQAARILTDLQQQLAQNNIFWNGAPDYDTIITEQDLIDNFPDSGLTKQTLADAMYAMSLLNDQITTSIVPITILAQLP